MAEFTSLQTTQLGTIAEQIIINDFASSKNYFPYTPNKLSSHPIDAVLISGHSQVWLDVKCKSRRKHYADTGFDSSDVESYLKAPQQVYILWLDIVQKKIYGNFLKRLIPFRKDEGKITYFPLDKMVLFRDMTESEYKSLKQLEASKYYK